MRAGVDEALGGDHGRRVAHRRRDGDCCPSSFAILSSKFGVCGVGCHVGCHVDDLLLNGKLGNPEWEDKKLLIKKLYAWGSWKRGEFRFAGLDLIQASDFSIRICQ